MRVLEYIFWRFWRFRLKKENGDKSQAYLSGVLFFGLFIVGFPMLIILKSYDCLPEIGEEYRGFQYLVSIPIVFLLSVPIRMLFPKGRVFNLAYSEEEKKRYNLKILCYISFFVLLVVSRLLYVKYIGGIK